MVKQNWSSVSTTQCSLEVIRLLHLPSDAYRISPHKYEPGVRFPERVSVPFVVYVLEGSCKYRLDNQDVTLTASEFATLPKGAYWFYVLGDCAVNLVKVYHLPKILKRNLNLIFPTIKTWFRMKIIKKSWAEISKEPISNDAIRALHLPTAAYTYRFSPHEY